MSYRVGFGTLRVNGTVVLRLMGLVRLQDESSLPSIANQALKSRPKMIPGEDRIAILASLVSTYDSLTHSEMNP